MTPQMIGRCAVHPDREAVATCSRCGNYGCLDCLGSGATICVSCEESTGGSRYHVVPIWRFLVMNVLTLATYQLYWMYKNWKQIKRVDRSDIWPAPRAFFGGVTFFSLITDLNVHAVARSFPGASLGQGWAVGYLISSMMFRLPDPWWLVSLISTLFLLPVAQRIWDISNGGARDKAGRWSLRHTVTALIAVPFWVVMMIGLAAGPNES